MHFRDERSSCQLCKRTLCTHIKLMRYNSKDYFFGWTNLSQGLSVVKKTTESFLLPILLANDWSFQLMRSDIWRLNHFRNERSPNFKIFSCLFQFFSKQSKKDKIKYATPQLPNTSLRKKIWRAPFFLVVTLILYKFQNHTLVYCLYKVHPKKRWGFIIYSNLKERKHFV